jgi:hypothetical protein
MTFEEALTTVWRQVLVDESRQVTLDGHSFPVRLTPSKKLRQVDFSFEGQLLRGLEQNPETTSRWAKLARAGQKVMQFLSLSDGRYIACVAAGKLILYSRKSR